MAPASSTATLRQLVRPLNWDANTTDTLTMSEYLAGQWHNPSDILSVLLLLGPDIVQRAIAQLAGRIVTPVAFSFGWMAYAASALLAAIGDGRLMPNADATNTVVIGATSGHCRTTKTWILGKLLNDLDNRIDEEMKPEQAHDPPGETKEPTPPAATKQPPDPAARGKPWEALRVSVFEVDDNPPCKHGIPTLDWVWFSGFIVVLVQLIISTLPWILNSEWVTFMVTLAGNVLALSGASLPQWSQEKWACPKTGGSTVTLTQGNGSRHVVVILGKEDVGLDLEILARGTRTTNASWVTRTATAVLTLLWIVLLVTVSGLKQNTWYLLGIGLLGSMQNLIAAGAARTPNALGVHIKFVEKIRGRSVAQVLKRVEEKYKFVGTSLLDVFFPGSLRAKGQDLEFWCRAIEERLGPNQYGTRVDCPPLQNNGRQLAQAKSKATGIH